MAFASIWNLKDQSFPPKPAPFTEDNVEPGSQAGRVFVVTGGNSGIGLELCRILYISGATIYLTARSKERAEAAIKSIQDSAETGTSTEDSHGTLKFLLLDLSDLKSVEAAAASFAAQEARLDVLWNNAGQGAYRAQPGQRTAQGFEPMVGIHCVATLLFTTLLLPQLRAAAAAERAAHGGVATGRTRVLWISSGMVEFHAPRDGIDFNSLGRGADPAYNYTASKTGQWFLAREMARRYGPEGILSLPVSPGSLKSNAWEGISGVLMFFFNNLVLHDTIYGAYTELYAGLSPELNLEEHGGVHIMPWGRLHPDDLIPRQDLVKAMKPAEEGGLGYAARMWDWCEEKFRPHVELKCEDRVGC